MKNVLLIMLILFSTNCFGQEIIDVNYSKYLKTISMSYDKNQNEKFDDLDPYYIFDGFIILDYKDFRTSGNLLDITINVGNNIEFKKRYTDIILYRVENEGVNYIVKNKYNETLFIIISKKEIINTYFINIYDLSILKE